MQQQTAARLWRLPLVCLWIGFGLVLAAANALLTRFSGGTAHRLAPSLTRLWMRGLLRILPLRVRYLGAPVAGAAIWASNHVSWIDIAVLGARAPLRFLSKAEVRRWPVIGWLANAAGTLYLQRGEGRAGEIDRVIGEALDQGQSVVIFAEGTTTDGSRVRAFHGRLLGSALRTGRPVQPVAIAYRCAGERDMTAPFIGDDDFTSHLWRVLGSSMIDVEVSFPPAVVGAEHSRSQLARSAHSSVVAALGLQTPSSIAAGAS